MHCFFCKRKIGPSRKRGKLDYHALYVNDPHLGLLTCVDCIDKIEVSIKNIRNSQRSET